LIYLLFIWNDFIALENQTLKMDADTAESQSTSGRNGPEGTPATDSIVLEEEIDPNYVPSEEEGN
jgi:hypothetical protein